MFVRKTWFSSIGRATVMASVAAIALTALEPAPARAGSLPSPIPRQFPLLVAAVTRLATGFDYLASHGRFDRPALSGGARGQGSRSGSFANREAVSARLGPDGQETGRRSHRGRDRRRQRRFRRGDPRERRSIV